MFTFITEHIFDPLHILSRLTIFFINYNNNNNNIAPSKSFIVYLLIINVLYDFFFRLINDRSCSNGLMDVLCDYRNRFSM